MHVMNIYFVDSQLQNLLLHLRNFAIESMEPQDRQVSESLV
jgi:transcriptional antiterminator